MTAVLHLLQQLEIEVTRNTEDVPDACLLKPAEQEIPDDHSPGTGTSRALPGYADSVSW